MYTCCDTLEYDILFYLGIIWTIWMYSKIYRVTRDGNNKRLSSKLAVLFYEHQQSHSWINSLRKTIDVRQHLEASSQLSNTINSRQLAFLRLQGYIKIGDLVRHPKLEAQLLSFLKATREFDRSVSSFTAAHDSVVTSTSSIVAAFCSDFSELLARAENHLCPQPNHRRRAEDLLAEWAELTIRLREIKINLSAAAASIIQSLGLVFDDLLVDIQAYHTQRWDISAHPRLSAVYNICHDAHLNTESFDIAITRALTDFGISTDHPLYQQLHADLLYIFSTQILLDAHVSAIRETLYEIDDTLRDFVNEIRTLQLDNLGVKIANFIGLVEKLHAVSGRPGHTEDFKEKSGTNHIKIEAKPS